MGNCVQIQNDKWAVGTSAILLSIVLVLWLFQVNDAYCASTGLLLICYAVVRPLPFHRWSFIDILLGLITLQDILCCIYSDCTIPAMRMANCSIACFASYGIARHLFVDADYTRRFFVGNSVLMLIALLLSLVSFFVFRGSVLDAGFEDTYHFRFLFRPLGYTTNAWAEVSIVLLGWFCLIRKWRCCFVLLAVFAVLLSFSRGAYIALGLFLIVWLLSVKPTQDKYLIPVLCLVAIMSVALCFPMEFKTTVKMNATVSQQQSTESRIESSFAAWHNITGIKKLFLGEGNRSFSYTMDTRLYQDSTQTYTNIAPNLPTLIWVEKGLLGLLFYLLLAVNVVFQLWKHRQKQESWILACILIALLTKEMTQAHLFNTPIVWLMLYLMLALLQKDNQTDLKTRHRSAVILPSMLFIVYLSGLALICDYRRNEGLCRESVTALKQGDTERSIELIEKTRETTPWLIQRGRIYTRCYLNTKQTYYAKWAERVFEKAQRLHPGDVQIRYMLADLYLNMDETVKARALLEDLVGRFPKQSLYLFAYWKCLYQDSNEQESLSVLTEAIRYTPRILTMDVINKLQKEDAAYYEALRHALLDLKPGSQDEPADFARLGYVFRCLGNRIVSKIYLAKAVEGLPNLSTPWRLLGEERKYRLLQLGAFRKNLYSMSIPEEPDMTDELLLQMSYRGKFWDWYGAELTSWEID